MKKSAAKKKYERYFLWTLVIVFAILAALFLIQHQIFSTRREDCLKEFSDECVKMAENLQRELKSCDTVLQEGAGELQADHSVSARELRGQENETGFDRIIYLQDDGTALLSNGDQLRIQNEVILREILEGDGKLHKSSGVLNAENDLFWISVPLVIGSARGALVGIIKEWQISQFLTLPGYGEEACGILCSSDGTILMQTNTLPFSVLDGDFHATIRRGRSKTNMTTVLKEKNREVCTYGTGTEQYYLSLPEGTGDRCEVAVISSAGAVEGKSLNPSDWRLMTAALLSVEIAAFVVLVLGTQHCRKLKKNYQQEKKEESRERQYDPVTEILCAEAAAAQIDHFLKNEGRESSHALLLVELENLDKYRKAFGDGAADDLLRQCTKVIQSIVYSTDFLGRQSDETFLILLKDIEKFQVISVRAAEICDTLRNTYYSGEEKIEISARTGISLYTKERKWRAEDLSGSNSRIFAVMLREAELALARTGDQTYEYFREPFDAERPCAWGDEKLSDSGLTAFGTTRKFQTLLNQLRGFLAVLSVDEVIRPLYISADGYRDSPYLRSGQPLQELNFLQLVEQADAPAVGEALRRCVARNETVDVTYQVAQTDRKIWHRLRGVRLEVQDNRNLVIAVVSDVTPMWGKTLWDHQYLQQRSTLARMMRLSRFEVSLDDHQMIMAPVTRVEKEEILHAGVFPDCILRSGLLEPSSVELMNAFAREIYLGKEAGEVTVMLHGVTGGELIRVLMNYQRVTDAHGHPVRVVGMCQVRQEYSARLTEEQINSVLRAQIHIQERYYTYIQQYQTDLRRYRHDRKNVYIALTALLNNNDIEGAKAYLREQNKEIQAVADLINTGNPAVDALLSEKIRQAKTLGILTRHMVGLSADLRVDSIDFCILLGCCLDNAIEACQRVIHMEKKAEMYVSLIERRNVIVFQMMNSSLTPEGSEDFHSTKEDTVNHGFGLKNISAIVKKYNGLLSLRQENGVFYTKFTIFPQ